MKVIPDKNNFIEILEECLSSGNSSFVFVKLEGSKSLTCRILPEYANGKKVRCVEDNKVFKSIKEAADYYDCHTKEIFQLTRPAWSVTLYNVYKNNTYHNMADLINKQVLYF